ncbi:MAG: histidine kinase [Gammaproteobacteria bacterium]
MTAALRERTLERARVRAAHRWVQPHFLLNTLASLDYMVHRNPPAAASMTTA